MTLPGITIGVVDDQALVRAALRRLLAEGAERHIAWEAHDGRSAIARYEREPVDVVVMDLRMPGKDGLEATRELLRYDARARVVIVTQYEEVDMAARSLRAGALGFVSKGSEPGELTAAIHAAAERRIFVSERLRAAVERYLDEGDPLQTLSDRELQVLTRLASGARNREIACQLCISVRTVDSHRRRILQKLGLRNNSDLTRFAVRRGLV